MWYCSLEQNIIYIYIYRLRFLTAWLSDKVSCQYAILQYIYSPSSIEQQGMHGIQATARVSGTFINYHTCW